MVASRSTWNNLKHIDEVVPLGEIDTECLVEVRNVLLKHKMLDRFGVALLHKHFDLESDEVLIEYSDEQAKSLTIVAEKLANGSASIGTIFQLTEGSLNTMVNCAVYCMKPLFGSHQRMHQRDIDKTS